MVLIDNYHKPASVAEAYQLLINNKKSAIVGGGAWFRLGSRHISHAIDLCQAGLSYITETDDQIEIGAMTTFGELARSKVMHQCFNGIIPASVKNIVGVQLQNMVTVGGTVYSKLGFSDLITALLVLDCHLILHKKGKMTLDDFLKHPVKRNDQDILEKLVLKKENLQASFQAMRNVSGDYALLNVAVSKRNKDYKIAVGARPLKATLAHNTIKQINKVDNSNGVEDFARQIGDMTAAELMFGTNNLASAEYRKKLCQVLVKRAIEEVEAR